MVVKLMGNRQAIVRNVSIRAFDDWDTSLALSARIAKYLALKHANATLTDEDRAVDHVAGH